MPAKHVSDVFSKFVCQAYSFILLTCGLLGFALANFEARAKSSLIAGVTTAATMTLCARLLGRPVRAPTAQSRRVGYYLALVLATGYAAVFAWRARLALEKGGKRETALILLFMTASSILAALLLIYARFWTATSIAGTAGPQRVASTPQAGAAKVHTE